MLRSKDISVVVATYNWPEALELVLMALRVQTVSPKEIVVADDGSDKETAQLIQQFRQQLDVPLKHIWHPDMGFRKTIILNKAMAAAAGTYFVQIDGDTVPERHFIEDHLRVSEPGVFVRGSRAHLLPEETNHAINKKKIDYHFYSKGVKHRNNAMRSGLLLSLATIKSVSSNSVRGSNLAFWRDDFINVNGYNNELQGWGHEDEELAARFINIGLLKKKVKLAAVQYHLYHKTALANEEGYHNHIIEEVRSKKITRCINGLDQVSNEYAK